ncbi:MAG: H-X9-DG-CTERM domain-containing protein [Isosphaeraceae bacterium]
MKHRAIGIGLGMLAVISLGLWGGRPVFEPLGWLLIGWASYPIRVAPRIHVAWGTVAMCGVMLAIFAVGLHRMLGWLYGGITRAKLGTPGRWSPRWSGSIVALIVLMFIVGIAASGVTHQAGWLIASPVPLVESKGTFGIAEVEASNNFRQVLLGFQGFQTAAPRRALQPNWMTGILPYLPMMLPGEVDPNYAWNHPRNSAFYRNVVPMYLNPTVGVYRSPEGYALAHYAGNVHVFGGGVEKLPDPANTILAGEVAAEFRPWGDPTNLRDPGLGINAIPEGFGGPSGSGAQMAMADGSVRFFSRTTDPKILQSLARPVKAPR